MRSCLRLHPRPRVFREKFLEPILHNGNAIRPGAVGSTEHGSTEASFTIQLISKQNKSFPSGGIRRHSRTAQSRCWLQVQGRLLNVTLDVLLKHAHTCIVLADYVLYYNKQEAFYSYKLFNRKSPPRALRQAADIGSFIHTVGALSSVSSNRCAFGASVTCIVYGVALFPPINSTLSVPPMTSSLQRCRSHRRVVYRPLIVRVSTNVAPLATRNGPWFV